MTDFVERYHLKVWGWQKLNSSFKTMAEALQYAQTMEDRGHPYNDLELKDLLENRVLDIDQERYRCRMS